MTRTSLESVPISTNHPPTPVIDPSKVPVSLHREYNRIARCRTEPAGYKVGQSRVYLRRCKSRLCTSCNRIRTAVYRNFIQTHLLRCFDQGLSLHALTLTIQHDSHESLTSQVSALKAAWARLTKKGLGISRGIHFYAAIVEFGSRGSHAHLHVVIAHDRDRETLITWLNARWQSSCNRLNRSGKQQSARELHSHDDVLGAAKYMTKQSEADGAPKWPTKRQSERLAIPVRWKGFFHTRVPGSRDVVPDWLSIKTLKQIVAGHSDDDAALQLFVREAGRISQAFRRIESLAFAEEIERAAALIAARLGSS